MKPIQIAAGFVAGIIVAFCVAFCVNANHQSPYQFISSQDGQILWQCNLQTGEVKASTSFIPRKTDDDFELLKGSLRDFIFNKQSGAVWRYYQNDSNTIPLEGFAPLNFGNPMAESQSTNRN